MPCGYLYVLVNPSIPGLVKVGKTTRAPAERASELSSATGVASPFILLYQQPVADCDTAEVWVHEALTARGWRYAANREFFSAPPHEVVSVVFQSTQVVAGVNPKSTSDGPASSDWTPPAGSATDESEGERFANLGLELIRGGPDTLADRPRGLALLQQGADLGFLPACIMIGQVFLRAEFGLKRDLQKAYRYLEKCADIGNFQGHALLAELFMENAQRDAAQRKWVEYFTKIATQLLSNRLDSDNYEFAARSAGEFGWNYCRFLYLGRIDDVIDDALFCVLAPYILQTYLDCKTAAVKLADRLLLDTYAQPLKLKIKRGKMLPAWAP